MGLDKYVLSWTTKTPPAIYKYILFQVYEAIIEDKGKNFIFFRLSKKCVSEMELKKDHEVMVQVCI